MNRDGEKNVLFLGEMRCCQLPMKLSSDISAGLRNGEIPGCIPVCLQDREKVFQ